MVIGGLASLLKHTNNDNLYNSYCKFISKLIEKTAKEVGWDEKDDDGHLGKLLRAIMVRLQCKFNGKDEYVYNNALKRYNAFVENPKSSTALPSDFKTPVMGLILSNADISKKEHIKRFNEMKELINQAETTAEKKAVYLAVGALPSKEMKIEVLDWASNEIVLQDHFYPFYSVARSGPKDEGLQIAHQYMIDNFDRLYQRVAKASPSIIMAIITACCSGFASNEKADQITKFFQEHSEVQAKRKVSQIVEATRGSAKFLTAIENSDSFTKYLS